MNQYAEGTTDGSHSFQDNQQSGLVQAKDRGNLTAYSSSLRRGATKALKEAIRTQGYHQIAGSRTGKKGDHRGTFFQQPQQSDSSQQVNFDEKPSLESSRGFDHYQTQQHLHQQDLSASPQDLSKLSFINDQRTQLNRSTAAATTNDFTRSTQRLINPSCIELRDEGKKQVQIIPLSHSLKRDLESGHQEGSVNTRSQSAASQYYSQAKQLSRMRKNLRSQQSLMSQKIAANKPRTVIQRKLQQLLEKQKDVQGSENHNTTNMGHFCKPSAIGRIQMTHSMYKQQQERHFEKLGVQSNIRPQSRSSKMYFATEKTSTALSRPQLGGDAALTPTRLDVYNRRDVVKTANSLMLNSQSRNGSFVIKPNSSKQDGGYIHLQTNVDGAQARIPMILTSDMDILLRTQSSENDLKNMLRNKSSTSMIIQQNSVEDIHRKQTVLSRQGAGPIGQMSPTSNEGLMRQQQLIQGDNNTSTGRTGTLYMSSNLRMQPKGLNMKQHSTGRMDEDIFNLQNGEYSLEMGTRRNNDDLPLQDYQKVVGPSKTQKGFYQSTSSYTDNHLSTQSPESSPPGLVKLNRWSSRIEGDPKGTSLADILITDQHARKNSSGAKMISSGDVRSSAPHKVSPMKPVLKETRQLKSSQQRYPQSRNKRQYISSHHQLLHSQVASKVFPAEALIPDYEEIKTRAIVDTYKKILTKQSEAEGRSQPVTVAFNEEKFFFEAGVNRPLFLGQAKKNPGFTNGDKNSLGAVVNKRSCIGVQITQEMKQRDAEMRATNLLAKPKNIRPEKYLPQTSYLEGNHYGEQSLHRDFNRREDRLSQTGSPFNHYNQNINMLPQNWTHEQSSPALLHTHEGLSDSRSPYRSPIQQQRGFDSEKHSEDLNHRVNETDDYQFSKRGEDDNVRSSHTRQITLSAYPQITQANKQIGESFALQKQDSLARNQNKIIYSINRSTKQMSSLARSKQIVHQDEVGTRGLSESRGYKSIEYRNLEGAINIKGFNQQKRSTLSSNHNIVQREPHQGSNILQVPDSQANSSIMVSQEHLEQRPNLLLPRNQDPRSLIASSSGGYKSQSGKNAIQMQRIELRLTQNQKVDPQQFEDDERVIMRESYHSQTTKHHQKNKVSSVSMKRTQGDVLESAKKKINQDLAGIKVPKKEAARVGQMQTVQPKQDLLDALHQLQVNGGSNRQVEVRLHTASSVQGNRYATLRALKNETMTNIMRARCKSAKNIVTSIPSISRYLLDLDQLLKQPQPNEDHHHELIINIIESKAQHQEDPSAKEVCISKGQGQMLVPPISLNELPDLKRRSSRNVMSKLQGKSLTTNSMRSLNNNTGKSKQNGKENSFTYLALKPEFNSQPDLNLVKGPAHDKNKSAESSQLIPQLLVIHDHFSTPTNEDAKKSVITLDDQQRKESEIPNDGDIMLAANYKKESSLIDMDEGFQKIEAPVLGKQASFAPIDGIKQSAHIIPSTISGPSHHRRRSSNNQDLQLIASNIQDPSPKRTVLIRKSNGPHDNLKIMPNLLKSDIVLDTQVKHISKQKQSQVVSSQLLAAIDGIPKGVLDVSALSFQQGSLKQRRITDLPRHGRVAPSVMKRNIQKMNQSKGSRNNHQTTTKDVTKPKEDILSATFHVMPVPASRNLLDVRYKTSTQSKFYQGNSEQRSVSPVYYSNTDAMQKVIIKQCQLAIDAEQQRQQLSLIRAFQAQNAQQRYIPLALTEPMIEQNYTARQTNSQMSPNHLKIPLPQFQMPTAHSLLSALPGVKVLAQLEPEISLQDPITNTVSAMKQKGGCEETLSSPELRRVDQGPNTFAQLELGSLEDIKRMSNSSFKQRKLFKASSRVRESKEGQITPTMPEGINVVGQQLITGKNMHSQNGAYNQN